MTTHVDMLIDLVRKIQDVAENGGMSHLKKKRESNKIMHRATQLVQYCQDKHGITSTEAAYAAEYCFEVMDVGEEIHFAD